MRLASWWCVAIAVAACGVRAAELDLAGTWTLTRPDKPDFSCPVVVPGGVHQALLDAKQISDPYVGLNEKDVQWVGMKDWTFSRAFDLDADFLRARIVTLRMEDVDCFATVRINGQEVGRTENRFRRWDFDVRPLLKAGRNSIEVAFESTARRSGLESMKYGTADCPGAGKGGRQLKFVRSVLCHGGWDWGISLVEMGLMGTVKLMADDDFRIDYVYTEQSFTPDYSRCDVTVFTEVTNADGSHETVTNRVTVARPKLWWPRGYGEPHLTDIAFSVRGRMLKRRIGLRKVELRRVADDPSDWEKGSSLTIVVNGRPVFCQGADWIPCDAIENRQTPERYRDLLGSAVAANMNMLRIWGGGQFEHDAFYDACDELGLLVWHDFLFACTIYPVTDYFMDNVRAELAHELKRLRDHASIAVWCGDNECISVANHYAKDEATRTNYVAKCAVREKALAAAARLNDPTRPFWTGSPCRGPGDFRTASSEMGDLHAWAVWFGRCRLNYVFDSQPRFVTEVGFQSCPSMETLERWLPKEGLRADSPEMRQRQKSPKGDDNLAFFLDDEFGGYRDFPAYVYKTQVLQSIALRHTVAAWRAIRSRCSGVVVWQLNDNWPVKSWSTVEYGGKWKMAHYALKRAYSPVAVYPGRKANNGGVVRVRAVNDESEPFAGQAHVELWPFDGTSPRLVETLPVGIPSHEGVLIADYPLSRFGDAAARSNAFLVVRLEGKAGKRPHAVTDDWQFGKFRTAPIRPAKIAVEALPGKTADTFRVRIRTDFPAFHVWANARGVRGEFDDNAFTLLPGRERTLLFTKKDGENATLAAFREALTVISLSDRHETAPVAEKENASLLRGRTCLEADRTYRTMEEATTFAPGSVLDLNGHRLNLDVAKPYWHVFFDRTVVTNGAAAPARLLSLAKEAKVHVRTGAWHGGAKNVLEARNGRLYLETCVDATDCWTLRLGNELVTGGGQVKAGDSRFVWPGPVELADDVTFSDDESKLESCGWGVTLTGQIRGDRARTVTLKRGFTLRLGSSESTFCGRWMILGNSVRPSCLKLLKGAAFAGRSVVLSDAVLALDSTTVFRLPQVTVDGGIAHVGGGAPGTTIESLRLCPGTTLALPAKAEKNVPFIRTLIAAHGSALDLNGHELVVGDLVGEPRLLHAGRLTVKGRRRPLADAGAAGRKPDPRTQVLDDLRKMSQSGRYYWAWTQEWGGGRAMGQFATPVSGRTKKFPLMAYYELQELCGRELSWRQGLSGEDLRYADARRSTGYAIRRHWRVARGLPVFSWHMGNPCVPPGKPGAWYVCREHPNIVGDILAGRTYEDGCCPRAVYCRNLEDVAAFFNGLVDDGGRPIPIVFRYPHEMDGSWFWWGAGHCTPDEFVRFCRLTGDFLREKCGRDRMVFAYTPDRRWKELGEPGKGHDYLSWYPGDDYVDVLGFDDYSIGKGETAQAADDAQAETVRKLRLVSDYAKRHGKVAGLSETGCAKARDDFWTRLGAIATAPDVACAFVNTWHGGYTTPATDAGWKDLETFLSRPEVAMMPEALMTEDDVDGPAGHADFESTP